MSTIDEMNNNPWIERKSGTLGRSDDSRSNFDRDYSRIIHSASFRRLQGKTQTLNLGDSDFYRTRLTHSLEVAQIGRGLVSEFKEKYKDKINIINLLPEQSLIETICLADDLGHPPFGHGGEVALNYCMRDNGGFEGNGQTLRILTKLENFSENNGADLTRRTLLGILKYPASYSRAKNELLQPNLDQNTSTIKIINSEVSKPPKCYLDSEEETVEWVLKNLKQQDIEKFTTIETISQKGKHKKTKYKSFDCSIMDIADDIAYGVHDLEDVITLVLVKKNEFYELLKGKCQHFIDQTNIITYDNFVNDLFAENSNVRKKQISLLVNYFIRNVKINKIDEFEENLLNHKAELDEKPKDFLEILKNFVVNKVIESPRVRHLEFKGQTMVVSVFEVFASDPKSFLSRDLYNLYVQEGNNMRIICDYIANMTDGSLLKTYERLFSPRIGSIFDKV